MTIARWPSAWGLVSTLVLAFVTLGAVLFTAQHAAGTSQSQDGSTKHGGHEPAAPNETTNCVEPTLRCATFATPHVAPDGTLWVVWAAAGRVFVARSSDVGRTFGPPVAATPSPVQLDTGGDARPQMVVDLKGRVVVSYAVMVGDKYVGRIMVAHSTDGGATFSRPSPISDNAASQRFITLALDSTGAILAVWIDKRHVVDAERAGRPFPGASLAFAWSTDGGRTFGPARIAHDNLCECCRLGVVFRGPKKPAVLFRNIFDGERDHAILTLGADGAAEPVGRVSDDHWAIDACPHHGPSLAIAPDGAQHVAWFSGGGQRRGLFYARSLDGGRTFSAPMPVGATNRQPARPYVLASGDQLWLAWKEFDGERSTIHAMISRDGGRNWSAPRLVAGTDNFSDHPLLIARNGQVFLSWLTRIEGYRVVPLEPKS